MQISLIFQSIRKNEYSKINDNPQFTKEKSNLHERWKTKTKDYNVFRQKSKSILFSLFFIITVLRKSCYIYTFHFWCLSDEFQQSLPPWSQSASLMSDGVASSEISLFNLNPAELEFYRWKITTDITTLQVTTKNGIILIVSIQQFWWYPGKRIGWAFLNRINEMF